MAVTRPLKEGSVTTYQAKVAAGFPDILASEMDADLDTIYAAWNGGLPANSVGAVQLIDGSVGTAELADLAVTTPKLVDGAVTWVKHGQLAYARVTRSVSQSFPSGASTVVQFDVLAPGSYGGLTEAALDHFKIIEGGAYVCGASLASAVLAGGSYRRLGLFAGATQLAAVDGFGAITGAAPRALTVETVIVLGPTTVITAQFAHDTGSALGLDMAVTPTMWIVRVG